MSGAAAKEVPTLRQSPSGSWRVPGRPNVQLGPASAAAVLGGLLLASAFDPFDFAIGMLAGPACLMVALQGHTTRASILLGFVFWVAFQGVLLVWLAQ